MDDTVNNFFVGSLLILTLLIVVVGLIMFIVYAIKGDVFQCVCETGTTVQKNVGNLNSFNSNQFIKNSLDNQIGSNDSALIKVLFIDGKPVIQHVEKLKDNNEQKEDEQEDPLKILAFQNQNQNINQEEETDEKERKQFLKIFKAEFVNSDENVKKLRVQFSLFDEDIKMKKFCLLINDESKTKEFSLSETKYDQEWIETFVFDSSLIDQNIDIKWIEINSGEVLDSIFISLT